MKSRARVIIKLHFILHDQLGWRWRRCPKTQPNSKRGQIMTSNDPWHSCGFDGICPNPWLNLDSDQCWRQAARRDVVPSMMDPSESLTGPAELGLITELRADQARQKDFHGLTLALQGSYLLAFCFLRLSLSQALEDKQAGVKISGSGM